MVYHKISNGHVPVRALDQAMIQLCLNGKEITEEKAGRKKLEDALQQCRDEYGVLKEELAHQAKKCAMCFGLCLIPMNCD